MNSSFLLKTVSETLAGRVEFIELSGFDISETGADSCQPLWLRGGLGVNVADFDSALFQDRLTS